MLNKILQQLVSKPLTFMFKQACEEYKEFERCKHIAEMTDAQIAAEESIYNSMYGTDVSERSKRIEEDVQQIIKLYKKGILNDLSCWEQSAKDAATRLLKLHEHDLLESYLKYMLLYCEDRNAVNEFIKLYAATPQK